MRNCEGEEEGHATKGGESMAWCTHSMVRDLVKGVERSLEEGRKVINSKPLIFSSIYFFPFLFYICE